MRKATKGPSNIIERNGVYYGRTSVKGKVVQRSLETGDLEVARQRIGKWLADVRRERTGAGPQTLGEAVQVFADRHTRRIKPATAARYAHSISNLLSHFGEDRPLDQLNRVSLAGYEHARLESGNQAPTVRRDLATLSIMLEVAAEAGYEGANPVRPFLRQAKRRGLSENPPRDRYLSHDEERALIAAVDRVPTFEHRKVMTRAFIVLSIDLGLRHEELLALEWTNVDLSPKRSEVYVPREHAKSGIGRRVPILPRSYDLLQSIPRHAQSRHVIHQRDGRRYGRDAMWRPLKVVAATAGIPGLTVHDLRRTCGCRLLQDHGLDMTRVSKWLGHASPAITSRHYAFLDVDHLHSAIEGLRNSLAQLMIGDTADVLAEGDQHLIVDGVVRKARDDTSDRNQEIYDVGFSEDDLDCP